MSSRSVQTDSPAETEGLGAELAGKLAPGTVVLVRGEVGAGKTTFVRGAARALGVKEPVTSPTFTLANRYRGREVTISHLDLYRLEGLEHEDPGLLEDYLDGGEVTFIEWPERGARELAQADVWVTLTHRGGDTREIALEDGRARAAGAGEARA